MSHVGKNARASLFQDHNDKTLVVAHEGFEKAGDNLLSRYSHYHGLQMLNGRVRNGNGCDHLDIVTGKSRDEWEGAWDESQAPTLVNVSRR